MNEIVYFKNSVKSKMNLKIVRSVIDSAAKLNGEIFVLAISGSILNNPLLFDSLAEDIETLRSIGVNIILVFNPFDKIVDYAKRLGIGSLICDGEEFTCDMRNSEIIEMICGNIATSLAVAINRVSGGCAFAMNGKDANFIEGIRYKKNKSSLEKVENIGMQSFEGEITKVHSDFLLIAHENAYIPIISPIAIGKNNENVHVGYENLAIEIAGAICASRLIFITDEVGLIDENGKVLKSLHLNQLENNYNLYTKHFSADFRKKIYSCLQLIKAYSCDINFVCGNIEHCLLLDLFTSEICGTEIKR